MKFFKIILGIILVALGLLWSLQGADLIRMKQILCFANCEPLIGGSITWLFIGIVVMGAGFGLLVSVKPKRQP